MPRDIDFHVGELTNTYLYNLDDLAAIADENRTARESEVAKCQHLITERAQALWKQAESQLANDIARAP
jgi:glutamyl-tRNA reductase